MNTKLIKKHFEKSLDTYNENAIVQNITAEKLIKELLKIKSDFGNVFEAGSGSGLLTEKIAKNLDFNIYCANDLTEKSKNFVQKIIPKAEFYSGNFIKVKPSKKPDLIISNAMFQWFENLEKVCRHCRDLLNKDGILAFSTFSPENYKEVKELTGISLNYKSTDEIKKTFEKDFEILYFEEFKHILKFQNPLQLLAHMKKTGVNSINETKLTFKDVTDFCHRYKEKFPDICLTYSPVILICKKL